MNPTPLGNDPGASQDTTRLLITVVLVTTLYGIWSLFLAPRPDPNAIGPAAEPPPPAATEPAAPGPDTPAPTDEGAPDAPQGTPELPEQVAWVTADVAGHPGQTNKTVEGGYKAGVTTRGGQISSFELTGYGDPGNEDPESHAVPNYNLVSDVRDDGGILLALQSRGGDVRVRPADSYELVSSTEQEVVVRRETAEGVRLTRTYRFDPARFGFTHELVLQNVGAAPHTVELDLILNNAFVGGGGSFFAPRVGGDAATCRAGEEHEGFELKDLEEDGPGKVMGGVDYAVSNHQYFLAAVLPDEPSTTSGCVASFYATKRNALDEKLQRDPKGMSLAIQLAPVSLQPGESRTLKQKTYFGPKQLQLLEQEGKHLDENIEFGIFGILSKPILWALVKLFDGVGNFGVAIILLTLLIKLLTFPLTQKSYVSMQQMKTLAPELKALQEKYANDRAMLGQKQMELYKEKNINPLAGCFPVLVQMPVWFALYRTLWNSVELYQQPFYGWITDLSQPDRFPLFDFPLLPFLVGGLMFAQTAMQPPPQDQPQMKYVLWAMPIMFTVFMFGMPAGLSLYMITNSVLTFTQQLYIKKKYA